MKRLLFTYTAILFIPLFLFGQSKREKEIKPDFMRSGFFFSKKDTVYRASFCFDEFELQIFGEEYKDLNNIINCKVFEKKVHKLYARSFLSYQIFIRKDSISKIQSEYVNIDNKTWKMKKYKNNLVVSENIIQVTDSISYHTYGDSYRNGIKDSLAPIQIYMKTKIVD